VISMRCARTWAGALVGLRRLVGSTLAIAYAQRHPERVTELVLRGIFLLRRSELEWFYQDPLGAGSLFPDHWNNTSLPSRARAFGHDAGYYRRLTSPDKAIRAAAARTCRSGGRHQPPAH